MALVKSVTSDTTTKTPTDGTVSGGFGDGIGANPPADVSLTSSRKPNGTQALTKGTEHLGKKTGVPMGGFGSGWFGGGGRPERKWRVDECPIWIDTYEMRRMGVFGYERIGGSIKFAGHGGEHVVEYSFGRTGRRPTLRLNFRWAGADRREFIELESLPDNLGGQRLYFICP